MMSRLCLLHLFFLALFALPSRADLHIIQPGMFSGQTEQAAIPADRHGADDNQLLAGALAYIRQLNAHGGIRGQQVKLDPLDFGQGVAAATARLRAQLQAGDVAALLNVSSTDILKTITVAAGGLDTAGIPLLGVANGRSDERALASPWVFYTHPSFGDEVVKHAQVLRRMSVTQVAIYSDWPAAFRRQAEAAFVAQDIQVLSEIGPGPEQAAQQVAQRAPQAILLLTDTASAARFVRALRASTAGSLIVGLSNLDYREFAHLAGATAAQGVGVSRVLPRPDDTRIRLINDYQSAMIDSFDTVKFSDASLEGYINARIACEALRRAGPRATGATVQRALDAMKDVEIGSVHLSVTNGGRPNLGLIDFGIFEGHGHIAQ